MTTIDEALPRPKRLSRKTRIILFFLVETVAAFLVGFAALFLNFTPAWSAERASRLTKPSDARSGSLLFKTEDGYADATRLGIDVDLNVPVRPSAPGSRRSSATPPRTGWRRLTSIRCRRAARSTR